MDVAQEGVGNSGKLGTQNQRLMKTHTLVGGYGSPSGDAAPSAKVLVFQVLRPELGIC